MRSVVRAFPLAVLLLAAVALPGRAQAPTGGSAATRTVLDGVFTEEQAKRGDETREIECSMCHGAQDWSRPGFINGWHGRTVRDLFHQLRTTMPYDAPGRLSRDEYTDIVAYILKINGYPAGKSEMKSDEASLKQIVIQPKEKK